MAKHHTNWHEAALCALQIDLKKYAHLLEYHPEYILGKNNYRIDLLLLSTDISHPIPTKITRLFKAYNIFEFKGVGASVTPAAYYKANGYAGLLIDAINKRQICTRQDISLTFLSFRHPAKLFRHLTENCNLIVEKIFPGVYHIHNEMYPTQVVITRELPPEEFLYLRCLTNTLRDTDLINRLLYDYSLHSGEEIYVRYMNQLANANINAKGDSPMVCEGILNLCGTSSKEIEERTANLYIPKINDLMMQNDKLASSNKELVSQNNYLKQILIQNGIAF